MTDIDDDRLLGQLRAAMAAEVRGHHLDKDAAVARALQGRPDRRAKRTYLAAIAASVVVIVAVAIGYVATQRGRASTPSAGATCAVQVGVLPPWARDGFSDPKPVMPYVLSGHGQIIAILWSRDHPLNEPPRADENNKILWVSPEGGMPLVIHAQLGRIAATRTVPGGPGPSIIDMPRAGCWTLQLTWGDHHDTMRLPYSA